IIAEYQSKIYNKLCQQSLSYFQENSSANLLMHITGSVNQVREIIELLVTTYIRDIISLIALIIVMLYSNIYLTLGGLIIGPAIYFIVSVGLRKISQIINHSIGYTTQIITVIQETIQGIKVIKAFSLEEEMKKRM